jgi:hypothetical protein
MLSYRYKAYQPGIKEQVVDMAINGSGIRDTARVLQISKGTVSSTLKKASKQVKSTLAMVCSGSCHQYGAGLRVWATQRCGVSIATGIASSF